MLFFFSSRRRHTRLQGDWSSDVCSSDLEALDRPSAISLAERMDAVPRLLEEGRQRPRRVPGHAEPLHGERVEFPRGQGALGGNPASPEEQAEPTEAREDRGPHIPTEFELLNRILDGVRRGVACGGPG